MKKYETDFLKFNELKPCTYEEFSNAKSYFEEASILERKEFLNNMFLIIQRCFSAMYSKKSTSFLNVSDIYSLYGLTDEDFNNYFNLFMEKFAPKIITDKYEELKVIEKERMIENIFEMAKLSYWMDLKKIAIFYNIKVIDVKSYIQYYAFQVLKLNKSKFTRFKKTFKAYHAFINSQNYNFDYAFEYYKMHATKEEKIVFKNKIDIIINNVKDLLNNKDALISYLSSIKFNLFNLYSIIKEFYYEDLLMAFSNLLKEYYEYADSVNWNSALIKDAAKNANLSYENYLFLAKIYAKKVLKINNIEEVIVNKRIIVGNKESRFTEILYQIIEEKDENVLFKLFDDNKIQKEHIYRFCFSKARNFTSDIQQEYKNILLNKYETYHNIKMSNRKPSFKIITELLNSPLSFKEFCKVNNLNVGQFRYTINNIEDPVILRSIIDKINKDEQDLRNEVKKEKEANNMYIETRIRQLISYIVNGININGIIKDFDLIDFFVLFKDVNHNVKTYPFLNGLDKKVLYKFFDKIYKSNYFNRDTLLNSYIQVSNARIINKDEIAYIISFMESYNLPMLDVVFSVALKRYLNNNLDIYKLQENTLK